MKEQTVIKSTKTTLIVEETKYNVIINTEAFFVFILKDIFSKIL